MMPIWAYCSVSALHPFLCLCRGTYLSVQWDEIIAGMCLGHDLQGDRREEATNGEPGVSARHKSFADAHDTHQKEYSINMVPLTRLGAHSDT